MFAQRSLTFAIQELLWEVPVIGEDPAMQNRHALSSHSIFVNATPCHHEIPHISSKTTESILHQINPVHNGRAMKIP
jgi:hypothetical protein